MIIQGNIYGGCENTGTVSCPDTEFFKNSNLCETFNNSTINIIDGTIGTTTNKASIYGGGNGQNTNLKGTATLTIGSDSSKPTIYGTIYGGANLGSVENTIVNFINNKENITDIFGGGYNSNTGNAKVNLLGGKATNVYGGSSNGGTTTNTNIIKTSTVETTNIFGGGYKADVDTSNVNIENEVGATNVYGGSNSGGTVTESNVNIPKGTTKFVYGGGLESDVITSNVNITGGTVTTIYGGSKTSGTTNTTNVNIESGNVTTIYGGGQNSTSGTTNIQIENGTVSKVYGGSTGAGVTQSNITLNGGKITEVYSGGHNSNIQNAVTKANGATISRLYGASYLTGTVNNSKVYIQSGTVENVYGGGKEQNGTINDVTVNIEAGAQITGNVYAGGDNGIVKSSSGADSNIIVNIVGGTINGNIYGGGINGNVINGNSNINIGYNAVNDSNLTKGDINILSGIYGAGFAGEDEQSYISVTKNSTIHIDGTGYNSGDAHTLDLSKHDIFGTGVNTTVGEISNVIIDNFGTYENSKIIRSIQNADNVIINNSQLELLGRSSENNLNKETSYTLNRIGNLKIKNGTYLYLRRGFNVVESFSSMVDIGGVETVASVTVDSNGTISKNVDNRIYTYESINLLIAKEEYSKNTQITNYGEVEGMSYYGLYGYSRITGKKEFDIYDPKSPTNGGKFVVGTYIEGKHKQNHDYKIDGFYTNIVKDDIITTTYITPTPDNDIYYDWILGEKTYKEEVIMIAKRSSDRAQENITLGQLYRPGATYDIRAFSINSLDTDIDIINKASIPTLQEDESKANRTFGLSMKNGDTGWLTNGETNFYTTDTRGTYDGTQRYVSDYSNQPPVMNLSLYNSLNITESRDVGIVDIVFDVRVMTGEDMSEGGIIRYSISVNIQTLLDVPEGNFITDTYLTQGHNYNLITSNVCHITDNSSMTAKYNIWPIGNYNGGDYRVLTSTCKLPEKTQITMIDYAQGNNPIVYYYEVGSSYDRLENGKYIYNLSNFKKMGSTNANYNNPNSTYTNSGYEEYRFILDFKNTTISQNLLKHKLQLELRDGATNSMKNTYMNSNEFNIYVNSRAEVQIDVQENEGNDYQIIEKSSLQFKVTSDIIMKTINSNIITDTYYMDKKHGLSIEIYDSKGKRVGYDKVKGINFVINNENYYPDLTGVTRIYLSDNMAKTEKDITMNIEGNLLESGDYKIKFGAFASYDGKFFGLEPNNSKEINISIIDATHGLEAKVNEESKVIDKTTGINLAGTKNLEFAIRASDIYKNSNIRVSLYKRNKTYTEGLEYANLEYTLVDLQDYITDSLAKPEENSLVSSNSHEYLITNNAQEYNGTTSTITNFIMNLKESLRAGGYKLEFKLYTNNMCLNTIEQYLVITDLKSVQ